MRRTLAILALLATAWPHAVVLECALGSGAAEPVTGAAEHGAGPAASHGHHGGSHAHHGGGGPSGAQAEPGSDAPIGGLQCAMVMACGLVMMKTVGDGVGDVSPETPSALTTGPTVAPTAVDLGAETPPPRRSA